MDDDNPELPDRDLSAYPTARVARLPSPATDKLSAVLIARPRACLIVRVTFHRAPCVGLTVKFSKVGDDGAAGDAVGEEVVTDGYGLAGVGFMVPAGLYVCAIQGQLPTIVSTVAAPGEAHPVVTPIDRPHFDVDESHEWHDDALDGPLPEPPTEDSEPDDPADADASAVA